MTRNARAAAGTWQDYDFVSAGWSMSPAEVRQCEKALKHDEQDLPNRLRLIGYYGFAERSHFDNEEYFRHLLWYVENHPTHAVQQWISPGALRCTPGYELVRKAWIRHVRLNCESPEILFNAAAFFKLVEPKRAEKYLLKGQELEPGKVDWPLQLSELYKLMSYEGSSRQRRQVAQKSFKSAFRAVYLHRRFRRVSYLISYEGKFLDELAIVALSLELWDEAKQIAQKLVELEECYQIRQKIIRPNKYCARAYGTHNARAIMGRIHAANSNFNKAESYLKKMTAGPIPFGPAGAPLPDLQLATELVRQGKCDAALNYLMHCRTCCYYQLNRFKKNPKAVSFLIKKIVEKQIDKHGSPERALIPFASRLEKFIELLNFWIREIEEGKSPELKNTTAPKLHPPDIEPSTP